MPLELIQAGAPEGEDREFLWTLNFGPQHPATHTTLRLILTLDPKDHVVREAVLYDQLQNTVTMSFNRVAINPGLSDTLFTFTPPKGAAVVPLEMR